MPTTSALPSEDTSPIVRRNVDGALRIGVWLPTSGPAAALGSPLAAGVELAVQEINEAGGVNGRMVQVANRDEGGDPATAYQALRELLEQEQVDVIVGPSSSRVALGAIDTLAAAHVVDCSPTASARDLGERRDNGFFFRTIGSDALEAVALTKAMIATGRTAFVVLYPDDDYGRLSPTRCSGPSAACGRASSSSTTTRPPSTSTSPPSRRWPTRSGPSAWSGRARPAPTSWPRSSRTASTRCGPPCS